MDSMKLFWKYYAFLFLAIVLNNGLALLNPNSPSALYYNTLIAFNRWYIMAYLFNILNLGLSIIAGILIFNYAFKIQILSKTPYWLFYMRLLSDLTGHSWEWQLIQANMTQEILWGLLALFSWILPIAPSYFAHWRLSGPAPRSLTTW